MSNEYLIKKKKKKKKKKKLNSHCYITILNAHAPVTIIPIYRG
jgi:hypothetical protein